MLTFLHHEYSICYRISSVLCLFTCTRAVVEEVFKMHAVVRHVGIATSTDFYQSIFYNKELCVRQQLLGRDEQ